jgi:hypothetical protein
VWYVSWFFQSALAFFGSLVLGIIVASRMNTTDVRVEQTAEYMIFAAIGAGLAVVVSNSRPSTAEPGRWVFASPVAIELLAVIIEPHRSEIANFFWVRPGPMAGESSWVLMLLTLPTWSCCMYSSVMWWRVRRPRAGPTPK